MFSSQAILPHRDTGEIRDYLKGNQDALLRQIPAQCWTVFINGEPKFLEAERSKALAKRADSAVTSGKDLKIASKTSGLGGAASNPVSRVGGQLGRKLSTTSSKPGSLGRRPSKSLMPTADDDIFGDELDARPQKALSKPVPPKSKLPGPPKAGSGTFKAPAALVNPGSNLQHRDSGTAPRVDSDLRQPKSRAELAEAVSAAVSTSRPQASALSGATPPVNTSEPPEVQSPIKLRPQSAQDTPALISKSRVSHETLVERWKSHHAAGPSRLDSSHANGPRRASEGEHRASKQAEQRRRDPLSRDRSPRRHGHKRSRSPSASSRSASRERGRSSLEKGRSRSRRGTPDRPHSGNAAHHRLPHQPRLPDDQLLHTSHAPSRLGDGHRDSHGHARTAAASREQSLEAGHEATLQAHASAPLAEASRPRSAREIIKGIIRGETAAILPADTARQGSGATSMQQLPGAPSLPGQSSGAPEADQAAVGQQLPPSSSNLSSLNTETAHLGPAEMPGGVHGLAADTAAIAGVGGPVAKTSRIGSTRSIFEIGMQLAEKSSKDADMVSTYQAQCMAHDKADDVRDTDVTIGHVQGLMPMQSCAVAVQRESRSGSSRTALTKVASCV